MKNSDVINKILKYHPQFPDNYAGCDGYKFGDPNAECNGIATALVPTVDVIRRTGELGCNLLVVHEPIFYSTEDYPDWRAGGKNSVYEEKKALLDKYGITVWRDHDHMHAHNPDSIFTGVIKYLGWENYYIPSEKSSIKVPMGYLFELPETTVKELGQYLEDKLAMNGLRIVGNPEDKIRKVAIVGHLFPGFGTQSETREYGTDLINAMEQGLDAIIPGEVIEWTVLSYVRDALALGRKKAVFNIGHFNMEELGMRYAQDWIGDLVDHINAFREGKDEILLRKLGDEEADFHYEAGDFSDKRVLLIEWTHAGNPNLKGVDISVFLYSTPEETLERRKKRARNANTDTPLIALVLELEQIMLNENAKNADIIQMMNGQILNAAEYKEMIGDR